MTKYLNYSYEQLKRFCVDCFKKYGFTEEQSKIISDVLLLSDLYGIESHGMQRLARYYNGIKKGLIKVEAQPEVVFETPVSAVIEGNDGMGQLISHKAMNLAIEKAKKKGMTIAAPAEQESEIESLVFENQYVKVSILIPINASVKSVVDPVIEVGEEFGDFIDEHVIITNVRTFTNDEINDIVHDVMSEDDIIDIDELDAFPIDDYTADLDDDDEDSDVDDDDTDDEDL